MHTIKTLSTVSLAASLILGLGTTSVNAADDFTSYMNYGKIKFGILQPTTGMDDGGFDTGGSFSAVYGRYLTKYLIVEGSIEVSGAENDVHSYNTTAGYYDQDTILSTAGYLLTIKGLLPAGSANLYAGGGVGLYSVTLESEIDSTYLGDLDRDESDSVFGAHVLAGISFDATDRIFFGIEGMYRWTGDADIEERVANIPVVYSSDLSGYLITANVGFRF